MNASTKISMKQVLDLKRRRYARNMTSKAVKQGTLVKSHTCQVCNEIKHDIEAHHIDYGQPLKVMWLCRECHGKAHRKNSKLNPNNNEQTPITFINEKHERVQISFQIPVKNFIYLMELAEKTGKPISKLVEKEILEKYPVQSNQLEFNFEVKNDKSQHEPFKRISSMAKNEVLGIQPKSQAIQGLRGNRNSDMPRMEGELFPFLFGHGDNASGLQCLRTCA
jgi:hypothetical protein